MESRATSVAAIITAAGSGTRMGEQKQFLELEPGRRLLDRTVETCRVHAGWVGVIVPPGTRWTTDGGGSIPDADAVVDGGADRFASVSAGLAAVPEWADIVVVHSASHPLASPDLLDRVVAAVENGADGVVPVLAAVDTIKRHNADGSLATVGREGYGSAQVPMAYRRSILESALATGTSVTEESMAVEAAGGRVVSVTGELTNIHVTDRASLAVARHLANLDLADSCRQRPGWPSMDTHHPNYGDKQE